jgi:hypothetical protein
MDEQLVRTLTRGDWTAEIYSLSLPGEFDVVYRNIQGNEVERVTGHQQLSPARSGDYHPP